MPGGAGSRIPAPSRRLKYESKLIYLFEQLPCDRSIRRIPRRIRVVFAAETTKGRVRRTDFEAKRLPRDVIRHTRDPAGEVKDHRPDRIAGTPAATRSWR
jgi:hypothetical protein